MSRSLPLRASLESLKKLSKSLDALRAGNPTARLSDVQLEVAREFGFASWRELQGPRRSWFARSSMRCSPRTFDSVPHRTAWRPTIPISCNSCRQSRRAKNWPSPNCSVAARLWRRAYGSEGQTPLHVAAQCDDPI